MIAGIAGDGESAAAMTPGSRWFSGRIALNRCVNMPRARVDAGVGLIERRVGMADGNDDVSRGESANRVDCSWEFGRERDQSKRAHRKHTLESVAMRLEVKRRDARRGDAAR